MKNFVNRTLAILFACVSCDALAVDWPAATGTCSTTLQTCIDTTSAGNTITINTSGVALSSGTLSVHKELKLIAGISYHPRFVNVIVDIDVADNKSITIQGFEFEQASSIDALVHNDSQLDILDNNWSLPDATAGQIEGINIATQAVVGLTTVTIRNNNIVGEGSNGGDAFVRVFHNLGGTVLVKLLENRITEKGEFSPNNSVVQFINRTGTLGIQMVGNEIRGGNTQLGISQIAAGYMEIGIISNLLTGVINENNSISTSASNKAIDSNISIGQFYGIFAHNTIDGVKRNAGTDGIGFDFSGHTTSVSSIYYIFNNIITNTAQAYLGPATGTNVSEASGGNNIFYNHGTISGFSLQASDLLADPLFKNEGVNYALSAGSPAIDKSNSTTSHTDVHDSGVTIDAPDIDADGLRRYKGAFVDAGAYEWGDRHIFHQASSSTSITSLSDTALNADANAMPQVTQIWNYNGSAGVYNDYPMGIYRSGGIWRLFNEEQTSMSNNALYHAFYPYGQTSDAFNGLTRTVYPLGGSAQVTVDVSLLNNNSDKRVFASNFWDGVYNPSSLEVGYSAMANKWKVGNVDGVAMLAGAKFNLYHQDTSRNVFRHVVSTNNASFNTTYIDHPLLNNNPCALPTVTQATATFGEPIFEENPFNIGVFYDNFDNKWAIFNQDGSSPITILAAAGGVFNVMVDPQQVYDCNQPLPELLFADGFE
jgi:hypothetical protein